MRFKAFERRARAIYEEIPEAYKVGIDGLTISADAPAHPSLPDVYTLGQCLTESYPSEWMGPDTTRSIVVLYHGSFQRLAALDPAFDWEEELWETLTHELRHHLESLADQDELGGVDYAMDEAFKRADGLDFDPWYYQQADRVNGNTYVAEGHYFVEQVWTPDAFEDAREIRFDFGGESWVVPRPEHLGDVHYVWIDGVDVAEGSLQLVLVRKRSLRERIRAVLGSSGSEGLDLWESEATATRA